MHSKRKKVASKKQPATRKKSPKSSVKTRASAPRQAAATKTQRRRSTKRVARAAPVRFVPGGPADNLEKIDHIVVLMMENRSFDHMLGYLELEGANPDVDGLEAGMSNSDIDNNPYEVHRLKGTVFNLDPGHGSR